MMKFTKDKVGARDPRWWFICCVGSNRDRAFRKHLSEFGILNYSPMKKIKVTTRGKTKEKSTYMMAGYVFVFGDHHHEFCGTFDWRGFQNVLNDSDDCVIPVKHKDVMELISRQIAGDFDETNTNKNGSVKLSIGDPVYCLERAGDSVILPSGVGRVISIGRKNATLHWGNKILKIPFCYLRKIGQ